MKIAIFGEHPGIRPPATFLIVSTYLHMYILVDTYVHILRTRWECTSTTSPSWWTPPPTGQSVTKRWTRAFFHDALLLFILFKKDPPAFRFHAIFEPFTCYCAVRTISDFTSPSPL